MGSWNKTCGLSNLHITSGTPVYVFVMEQNTDRRDRCYTTALFKPCLLPFESVYDDYGGGENSGGVGFPIIMDALKQTLHELPQGENQYHDIAVTVAEFGEELFFRAAHEGRLQIKKPYSEPEPIEFVMFRRDVVDQILANYEVERYVGGGAGTGGWGNNYIYFRFADIVADVPAFIDVCAEKIRESQLGKYADMPARYRPGISFDAMCDRRGSNKAAWYVPCDTHRYARFLRVADVIVDLIDQGETETAIAIMTEYLRGSFLDSFMSSVRKVWVPGCHEGSQEQGHAEYRVLAQTVLNIVNAECAEDEAEDDD